MLLKCSLANFLKFQLLAVFEVMSVFCRPGMMYFADRTSKIWQTIFYALNALFCYLIYLMTKLKLHIKATFGEKRP